MHRIIVACLIAAGALAWRGGGPAIAVDLEPRLILAPSGTLRAGLYPRSKALPDVPTVAEAGISGYDASVWWGFLGPAGMAPDLVTKIHADLAAALKDPVVLTALEKMGATPVGNSPKDFDAFMRAEAAKWEPVLKEANIKMQ